MPSFWQAFTGHHIAAEFLRHLFFSRVGSPHGYRANIKNDEPQGNQVFCQMFDCIPVVATAMQACMKVSGASKLFSATSFVQFLLWPLPDHVGSVLVPVFSEVPIMGYIASGGGLLWIAVNPNSHLDVCLANKQGLSLTSSALYEPPTFR